MPRTTRNQEPGQETGPRRAGQDASAAVAERDPAGRGARKDTGADRNSTPAASGSASQRPSDTQQRQPDPSYDDIARRAYELYQERGGTGGQEVDDWLRAETELRDGRGRRDDEV